MTSPSLEITGRKGLEMQPLFRSISASILSVLQAERPVRMRTEINPPVKTRGTVSAHHDIHAGIDENATVIADMYKAVRQGYVGIDPLVPFVEPVEIDAPAVEARLRFPPVAGARTIFMMHIALDIAHVNHQKAAVQADFS